MTYKWDSKKPTAQMLGRWQPFHDGHYNLFKEIIKKTGQVCIQIRDVQGVDDNPFDFKTVKKNIEDRLNPEFEGRFKIMLVPNVTNICYGRGVGYKIEEIVLPEEIQKSYMMKSYYLTGGRTGIARRISWDEPCLTLTTSPSQKQTERCHPDETRPFTVREYARIQTFPDEWEFLGGTGSRYKQIGNAVPVDFAYHLGRSILNALSSTFT